MVRLCISMVIPYLISSRCCQMEPGHGDTKNPLDSVGMPHTEASTNILGVFGHILHLHL